MDAGYKQLTDFLVALGTDQVPHTEGYFLGHLIGVYRELKAWGAEEPVSMWPVMKSMCCLGAWPGWRISRLSASTSGSAPAGETNSNALRNTHETPHCHRRIRKASARGPEKELSPIQRTTAAHRQNRKSPDPVPDRLMIQAWAV